MCWSLDGFFFDVAEYCSVPDFSIRCSSEQARHRKTRYRIGRYKRLRGSLYFGWVCVASKEQGLE